MIQEVIRAGLDTSFERINVQEVLTLVKGIDGGKATGLDNTPCKLLKIAADVVAPSLKCIFNQSLLTGIYPTGSCTII